MKVRGRPDVKVVVIGTMIIIGLTATYSMPIFLNWYNGIYEEQQLKEMALFVGIPLCLFYSQLLFVSYTITEEAITIKTGLWKQRVYFRHIVHMQQREGTIHVILESRWFNLVILRPRHTESVVELLMKYHLAAFQNGAPIE